MIQPLLDDRQRRDWLRLIQSENVGPVAFFKLLNRFGGAGEALAQLPELSLRGGLKRQLRVYPRENAERDMANAAAIGARFTAFGEDGYPALLRHIDGAPPLICVRGDLTLPERPCVAIVGSRNASAAGRKLTRQFATELGEAGHVIVSGMARGIDTAAHEASLKTGTVAVLASGLDIAYPPENRELRDAIGETGLLISENPPGTAPHAKLFPRRNRIISGLSLATVVVEAALRSGSLITARLAGEHGRELFAVPGSPLDPRAEGTNRLIRDGAQLALTARDIMDALGGLERTRMAAFTEPPDHLMSPQNDQPDLFEPDQAARDSIVGLLGPAPVTVDDLVRESGAGAQIVTAVLLELELAGRLQQHGRQMVSLIDPG